MEALIAIPLGAFADPDSRRRLSLYDDRKHRWTAFLAVTSSIWPDTAMRQFVTPLRVETNGQGLVDVTDRIVA